MELIGNPWRLITESLVMVLAKPESPSPVPLESRGEVLITVVESIRDARVELSASVAALEVDLFKWPAEHVVTTTLQVLRAADHSWLVGAKAELE